MASLDSTKTMRNLLKKGFQKSNTDHFRLEFYYDGKFVLHTKISFGGKHELGDYLIKQMSDQCKLDKLSFLDLARCPLSKDDYILLLKEQGLFE